MKEMDAIAQTILIMGNKHRLEVVCHLMNGTCRFNELKRKSGKMNATTLSRTLKFLERHGIIVRAVADAGLLSVEYSLTKKGKEFSKVMEEMGKWGKRL